ncbi:hypothetical protein XAB3213_4880001 [Xanthomonas citri pv. bilvae]|nr:hypothetical protein XAB3213_4880001 [Xanthomonas citri pv. bilvae]
MGAAEIARPAAHPQTRSHRGCRRMSAAILNELSRKLRRASGAVAGFGLGGLTFAAIFARPQLWAAPWFRKSGSAATES